MEIGNPFQEGFFLFFLYSILVWGSIANQFYLCTEDDGQEAKTRNKPF